MDALPAPLPEAAKQAYDYMLWLGGFLGAVTRVCLLRGNGTQMNNYQITATLISGTMCAGTGSTLVSNFVPGIGTVSLGLSAYIAGMFGMVIAEYVVKRGFKGDGQ
jgi:hypothetical protein